MSVWCIALAGTEKWMQVGFSADFTHDDPEQTLILIDAFPEGTRTAHPFREHIEIAPSELVTPEYQVWMMVKPVVSEEGKNWTTRIVFVDQLKRRYKSQRVEFTWAGPRPQVAATATPAK